MSPERIKEMHIDFTSAVERLEEATNEDPAKGAIVIDGTIQRFEFTFELAWKLARAILKYQGIEAEAPRQVIKEAFKARMIQDGQQWLDMLEDRNKSSHIYDERQAVEIHVKIKTKYFQLLKNFQRYTEKFLEL